MFADINDNTAKEAVELSKKYATHPDYQATTYKLDVTDVKAVHDLVGTTVKTFGRLDYAINGAGVSTRT